MDSVNFDRAAGYYDATRALPADSIERQLYSWTWPYTAGQMRAVCGDIRAWAAREDFPVDAGYQVESDIAWWVFELPG